MFNWSLFLILVAISLPGIIGTAPKLVLAVIEVAKNELPEEREVPSPSKLMGILIIQNFVFGLIFAALGTFITPRIGFEAPVFTALLEGVPAWIIIAPQLIPILVLGVGGALVFVALYYLWYRPQLDEQTVAAMESLRMKLGLKGRLLYGGIFEEVLARWGLLSLFVWLGKIIFGVINPVTVWISIILSGILFGIFHLPNYLTAGCKVSFNFISLMITLNLWGSLIFGWLFWQQSLVAAMLAHMLFHLVWYPLDQHFINQSTI